MISTLSAEEEKTGEKIKEVLIDVPDFPKSGIIFKDVTPIFSNPDLCKAIIQQLGYRYREIGVDCIIGLESRGFLLGMPLAIELGIPFVMVRKKGKLPRETFSVAYELEYGSSVIEVHKNDIAPYKRIVIHDDVLATGGTAEAAASLVRMAGSSVVGFSFLVSIQILYGAKKLEPLGAPLHIFAPC
ncbi:MAG: adenine phosphoribosyltransferase [Flavobacteriales bacterium]|nr:adenine phosphoribosyltransferase [Flavobacteriales bacterium]